MRQKNMFSGMGRGQSNKGKSHVWLTPRPILDSLGEFDLDPCGARNWLTARHHYYVEDNGLKLDWFGRVWMNPPYDRDVIPQWMARMADHNHGTALIFARTDTDHFQKYVFGNAQSLLFLSKRINFLDENLKRSRFNAGAPSVLIGYGEQDTDVLSKSDLKGSFVLVSSRSYFVVQIHKTWRDVVEDAFLGEPALLSDLYERIEGHNKTRRNVNWRAKIRQIVQIYECFERIKPGYYRVRRSDGG